MQLAGSEAALHGSFWRVSHILISLLFSSKIWADFEDVTKLAFLFLPRRWRERCKPIPHHRAEGGKKQKEKKKRLFKVDLFNATFKLVGFR